MITWKFFLYLIVCFTITTSCGGLKMNKSITNKNERVKDFLDTEISELNTPGVQYLVLSSDNIIFEYSGGLADIKNKSLMNSNTTMMAFSMTKTITAVAVLQLIEKGKLNLNDSIDKYIDNNPYGKKVTIKHLLSQTSGIPSPIPLKWVHLAKKHKEYNEDLALNKILKENKELKFNPGQKYAYSNISYWLLGKIIENVSGLTYQDYIYNNITKPLQLTKNDIDTIIPDKTKHAKGYLKKYSFMNMIKGFLVDKDLIGEYESNWLNIKNVYLNGPAFGGLIGSAHSFSKFLQDQLKEKSVLFNNKTKKLLYTQQQDNNKKLIEMSLGWHIANVKNIKYFFKEGGGAGYHSEMRIYPKQKIATIIIVNKTSLNTKKYLNFLDKEFLY